MGRYQELIGRQTHTVVAMLFAVALSFSVSTELKAQTKKGLQMKMAGTDTSQVSATGIEGMPERGRFQFWYSYSGESIDATIQVSKNGTVIGEQSGLSPVTDVLLADAKIEQGDVIVVSSHFKDSHSSGAFGSENVFGHSAGLWYSFGNGAFYALDQEGNIIEVFGTWDFNLALTPPWNGIEVTANPESISPGNSSSITLQPYETPSEPVIIPDVTYINLQTSFLGDLIGGLGLPEYGIRYTQGFVNAPWGLLNDTNILYEVHPSIEASDDFEIPVVAYSPYDTGINGSTAIEVKKEEELELILNMPAENEIWPTLPKKYGGNPNSRNVLKNISVQVLKKNEPAKNEEVKITTSMKLPSGGHEHTNQPDNLGIIKDQNTGNTGNGLIIAKTNKEGKIPLEYISNAYGGVVKLTAVHTSSSNVSDQDSLLVRVTDLDSFENAESNIWRLSGNTGTTSYHKCDGDKIEHSYNHFLKPSVSNSLQEAVADYFVWTGTEQGGEKNLVLGLNDMSLPNGGLFDICGDWKPGHSSHRIGIDVDADRTALIFNNSGESVDIKKDQNFYLLQELAETIRDKGGDWIESIGLHFRF